MSRGVPKSTVLAGALLAACGGAGSVGVAHPAPGAVESRTDEIRGADPPKDPLAEPVDAPLALGFAYRFGEEHARALSFESDGASAEYALLLDPSGAATLTVRTGRSHAAGPSGAQFRHGAGDETVHEQSAEDRVYRGSFVWAGTGFSVALVPEEAVCKSLVAGKGFYAVACVGVGPLELTCRRTTVEALPPFEGAAAGEGGEPADVVDAFSCSPPFALPAAGSFAADPPGSLLFASAPGLEVEYFRSDAGGTDAPELRLARPESEDDLRLD